MDVHRVYFETIPLTFAEFYYDFERNYYQFVCELNVLTKAVICKLVSNYLKLLKYVRCNINDRYMDGICIANILNE